MLRLGRAVEEVPLAQRPLLALDEERALAGEHEEVLPRGLGAEGPRLSRRTWIRMPYWRNQWSPLRTGTRSRWHASPSSDVSHWASRTLTTNQPLLAGRRPELASVNVASWTTSRVYCIPRT